MFTTTRLTAALLTAVTALSGGVGVAAASAKATTHAPSGAAHAKAVKASAVKRTGAGGTVVPKSGGHAVAMVSAFPTGGKGSGTEATCALWSQRLQEDQQLIDDAPPPTRTTPPGRSTPTRTTRWTPAAW